MTFELTEDSIFHGALRLFQPRRGYRFTEDAVFLAAFAAAGGPVERAVDLGAGCGVIGLGLLNRGIVERLILVEIQRAFADLCRQNIELGQLGASASVVAADLREVPIAAGSIELVLSNPPYLPLGRGHLPSNIDRAVARHEVSCTPTELARAAVRLLRPEGRLVVVYPEARWEDARRAFTAEGLSLKRVRRVLPGPGRPPSLVMIEATLGLSEQPYVEEPHLLAHEGDGTRGEEVKEILAGRWSFG